MNQYKEIEDGVFLGAQPTGQDLSNLKHQGIRTVIDFRQPGETPAPNENLVKACGLDYVNIPVNRMNLSADQIDELDCVMQQKQGPFLLHCGSGARAAMLLALSRAKRNDWTAERTFEEAKAMGFDLKNSPEFSAFVMAATQGKQHE
jgi:uncharacterized protein (TIGR01244 family)